MRTSYARMASRVTPPTKDEGAKVDGAVEAGGVTVSVCGRLSRSQASLRRMVAASMAHTMEKCVDSGWETEKWQRIRVIAEGKMSLSRVAVFL